jgi:hypothetical protein
VEHKSFSVQHFSEEQSNDSRVDDSTMLEELREVTVIQSVKHQQAMRRRTERLFTQLSGRRFCTAKDPDD